MDKILYSSLFQKPRASINVYNQHADNILSTIGFLDFEDCITLLEGLANAVSLGHVKTIPVKSIFVHHAAWQDGHCQNVSLVPPGPR